MIVILFFLHFIAFWLTVLYSSKYPTEVSSLPFRKILPQVLFNQLIITPLVGIIFFSVFNINDDIDNNLDKNLDNILDINLHKWAYSSIPYFFQWFLIGTIKFILQFLVLNSLFSSSHYLCHKNKFLFNNVHYLHHKLIIPQSAGAIYCHPIEQIFVNLLPVFIPLILIPTDPIWVYLFIIYTTYEAVMGHTPFLSKSSRHNLHHKWVRVNFDNYPYFFDKWIGTYREF